MNYCRKFSEQQQEEKTPTTEQPVETTTIDILNTISATKSKVGSYTNNLDSQNLYDSSQKIIPDVALINTHYPHQYGYPTLPLSYAPLEGNFLKYYDTAHEWNPDKDARPNLYAGMLYLGFPKLI